MTRGELSLAAFASMATVLVLQLIFLATLRRPSVSIGRLLLAGPMLFVHPTRYLRDGHSTAPWRMLAWFSLWLVLVGLFLEIYRA